MSKLTLGTELSTYSRQQVLSRFVHRFTGDNLPDWACFTNKAYQEHPHFADDDDWLANTSFYVRDDGGLDERYTHCVSSPTWPKGKGIWGQKGVDY